MISKCVLLSDAAPHGPGDARRFDGDSQGYPAIVLAVLERLVERGLVLDEGGTRVADVPSHIDLGQRQANRQRRNQYRHHRLCRGKQFHQKCPRTQYQLKMMLGLFSRDEATL